MVQSSNKFANQGTSINLQIPINIPICIFQAVIHKHLPLSSAWLWTLCLIMDENLNYNRRQQQLLQQQRQQQQRALSVGHQQGTSSSCAAPPSSSSHATPPTSMYLTLKPLIFFMFFSTIFMLVAVGILLLAIYIVDFMMARRVNTEDD